MIRTLIAFILLAFSSAHGAAGQIDVGESELKTAFLYNIVKFVTWPDGTFHDPSEAIVVGVLQDDLFREHFDQLITGRRILGHPVKTKLFQNPKDITGCQVLFVPHSYDGSLKPVLDAVKGDPVLTIGNRPHFARNGGMINLAQKDETLTIRICRNTIDRAGLHVNSQLLKLADLVLCEEDRVSR